MINDDLKTQIVDDIFLGDRTEWSYSKTQDLSNLAGVDIEVFPPGAETIDEVESFSVDEGVMGSIFYKFERKPKNERS